MNENYECNHSCPHCCDEEVEWYGCTSNDVASAFRYIAKQIEGTRILHAGGYAPAKSVCEIFDEQDQHLQDEFFPGSDDAEKASELFHLYFQPTAEERYGKKGDDLGYWWGNPYTCSDEQHQARVLACLFFAAMLDDDAVTIFERT